MTSTASDHARFMGKVAAGATHELRNVLAIIKESAGLIEDVLAMAAERGAPPDPDKLRRASGRIDAQVRRGSDLITALNRFAHCPDEGRAEVDLAAAAALAAALSDRFVRQKGHRIEVAEADRPVVATTSPLGLQLALFTMIDWIGRAGPPGSQISVAARLVGELPGVEVECRDDGDDPTADPAQAESRAELETMADELGGRLETGPGVLRLTFPSG